MTGFQYYDSVDTSISQGDGGPGLSKNLKPKQCVEKKSKRPGVLLLTILHRHKHLKYMYHLRMNNFILDLDKRTYY